MWGQDKQGHYRAGRDVQEVKLNQIEGICNCGYLTLKPTNEFEEHNGGLTVKRSRVKIVRKDGTVVRHPRGKGIQRYGSCNACANGWR